VRRGERDFLKSGGEKIFLFFHELTGRRRPYHAWAAGVRVGRNLACQRLSPMVGRTASDSSDLENLGKSEKVDSSV